MKRILYAILSLVREFLQRAFKFEPPFETGSKLKKVNPPIGIFHFFSLIFEWVDPFQLNSWSEGWLKLKSSLEKPSDKC